MSKRKKPTPSSPPWLDSKQVDAARLPKPTRISTSLTAGPAAGGMIGIWLGCEAIAMTPAEAEALAWHLLREVDLHRRWQAERQPEASA
jgi:hypothetical protein